MARKCRCNVKRKLDGKPKTVKVTAHKRRSPKTTNGKKSA